MTDFYTEDYTAQLKVLLGGTDITDSILSYSDIIEGAGQEMFKLGETPSKEITLELRTDGLDLTLPFDISFEITEEETVKVGRFYLLDFEDTYEKVAILKLYDAMSLFDAPYISTLDYEAGTTTRQQIQEMCDNIGIDTDTSFVRNKIVKWYDSTITMRTYIQWIAEISGCSAIICRDGCLEFKPIWIETPQVESATLNGGYLVDVETQTQEVSMKTLPLDKFWNYTRKEVFNVSRVLFNNGLVEYSIGDELGNTIYLNTKNGYIDTADDLDHLRFLLGFSCSYITDMAGLGDPRIDFGDVCAVYDYVEDTTEYIYINYAGLGYFAGKFSNELKSNVQTKAYEQVADYIGDATIKRIQVQVDANSQSLEVVSQKTEDNLGYIGQLAMDYEEFKTSYSKGYVTEEGMEAYVGTQISQNAEEIRFTFEQALGTTEEKLSGDLSEYEDYIAKFIRFVDGQIELGNSASPFQLVISNTGIEIQNNGSPVAYFQNDKMLISKAVIEHSLQIGNVAFIPDAGGSMSLRKV